MRWNEWQCHSLPRGCPCSYPTQPLLRLRGLCSPLPDWDYSPKQLPDNPGNMIILGQYTTRIEYNDTTTQKESIGEQTLCFDVRTGKQKQALLVTVKGGADAGRMKEVQELILRGGRSPLRAEEKEEPLV